MASNNSDGGGLTVRRINSRMLFVQFLVAVFLCINLFLIMTFFMKDHFYTTMRYILFAVTLMSDCMFLLMSNVLLILSYFRFTIQMWLCLIMYIVLSVYTYVTLVTLTAMTLERYVAICMPLRHAELCTTRGALHLIIIIHSISSFPCTVNLSIFFATVTDTVYTQNTICFAEIFIMYSWQGHLRSAISQIYFLVMYIIIVFSYVQIIKVAKVASGENKKSSQKGLRTVMLHAFQLLLCLIQLWFPFIEAAVLKIDIIFSNSVRYFNYIFFTLAPRCLSPLIYGLRDEMFYQSLKYYALCGPYRKLLK